MKMIGYGSYGSVRGYGSLRETREEAESDVESDREGCSIQGGDRSVVVVDDEGYCYYLGDDEGYCYYLGDDEGAELRLVWGNGGAARYGVPARRATITIAETTTQDLIAAIAADRDCPHTFAARREYTRRTWSDWRAYAPIRPIAEGRGPGGARVDE